MAANLACIRNISSRFASCWKYSKINQRIRQVHGTEVSLAGSLRDIKRFYKNVTIEATQGGFLIKLDTKPLKTRNGQQLIVPNELLAVAVATEWAVQGKKIAPHNMPLTVMCNGALDRPNKDVLKAEIAIIMDYLATDTICIRATEPTDLVAVQNHYWDPLLEWMKTRFQVQLSCSTGITCADHPPAANNVIKEEISRLDAWSITGLSVLVESLKSLVIALAVTDRYITIDEAVDLSRLEINYQTAKWGKVEWAHDLEVSMLKSKTAAAAIFYQCSQNATIID